MHDELTPEEQFAADPPEEIVHRALRHGESTEAIVAILVRHGWAPVAARALVDEMTEDLQRLHDSPGYRQHLIENAKRQFLVGICISLLSVAVAVISPLSALAGYQPYLIVASGAFFLGLVVASRGWGRWRLYRKTKDSSQAAPAGGEETK